MEKIKPFLAGNFLAMGCPCAILVDTTDSAILEEQLETAHREARRIEEKYSRFRPDTIVDRINTSAGKKIKVDPETAAILDFAQECYEMSGGLFDITRSDWKQVIWKRPFIQVPKGMTIDFGGICKEYAADQILSLLIKRHRLSTLVNLGGDIAAAGDRVWSVGIEDVERPGTATRVIQVRRGGVATSGTIHRPGHLLDPKTGQPVLHAPQSVTVAAKTCTEAGFWSTLAVLHGHKAEAFLKDHALESWCSRSAA